MSEQTFEISGLSVKQARILIDALDLYSRLQMGQVEEIEKFYRWNMIERVNPEHRDLLTSMVGMIKKIVFPELNGNASYSICGNGAPDAAKIAYDIQRVIRHRVAWTQNPNGGIQVDFDDPDYPYGSEGFISATVENKNPKPVEFE